jgi:hypothetical protein
MWVLIAPEGRPGVTDMDAASSEQFRDVLRGVVGYFGSYRVDEQAQTVSHHVEIAVNPKWVGRTFVRRYAFANDRLTLTIDSAPDTIETVYRRLRHGGA